MNSNFDNDNYWNESSVGNGFDFDEDTLTPSDNLAHLHIVDSTESTANNQTRASGDDRTSEVSFESNATDLSTISLSVQSLIGDEALKTILEEQTLEDVLLVPKDTSLEDEVRLLRRQMQMILYNPAPEVTTLKLLLGKRVSLEVYRSLQDKQELLDTILRNGCPGDALIYVLLFIERSLKRDVFYELLRSRPKALQHYLIYLKETEPEKAMTVLRSFGRDAEAILMEFESILHPTNTIMEKHMNLKSLLERISNGGASASREISLNSDYLEIIECSLKFMDFMTKLKSSTVDLQSSPVQVLYDLCGHPNNRADSLSTLLEFCAQQRISNAQFEWTMLNACARCKSYGTLEAVFEKDSRWPGLKTKQFQINFDMESAVQRLYDLGAPDALLYRFLSHMPNGDEKLQLATRVNCQKMVIDILLARKDTKSLQSLRQTLTEKSELQFHCDNALKSLQEKRWLPDQIKRKL